MRYMIKTGVLSVPESGRILARIRGSFWGGGRTIALEEGGPIYETAVDTADAPQMRSGDVRFRSYILKNSAGLVLMQAHPGYAGDEDPDVAGWPLCRMPRVDHAQVQLQGTQYLLVMHNSQSYALCREGGAEVLRILHRGLPGGWLLETAQEFPAQVLCALFLFCRCIERENEFVTV